MLAGEASPARGKARTPHHGLLACLGAGLPLCQGQGPTGRTRIQEGRLGWAPQGVRGSHGGPGATQDRAEGPGSASHPGPRGAAPAGHDGATSQAPEANAVPQPNPPPRPSWPPETGPQKAEITPDTGPRARGTRLLSTAAPIAEGPVALAAPAPCRIQETPVHRQEARPPQATPSRPCPVRPGLCKGEAGGSAPAWKAPSPHPLLGIYPVVPPALQSPGGP